MRDENLLQNLLNEKNSNPNSQHPSHPQFRDGLLFNVDTQDENRRQQWRSVRLLKAGDLFDNLLGRRIGHGAAI